MLKFLWLSFLAICSGACVAGELPAEFDHNRIHLVVKAPDESKLRIYTDSGGGWNALATQVVERLHLPVTGETEMDDGGKLSLVDFPDFLLGAGIPSPVSEQWLTGHLAVTPSPALSSDDGMLGSRWFASHVWKIDYRSHRLFNLQNFKPTSNDHTLLLNFRNGIDGNRKFNLPRIDVTIDGSVIPVLLDTGATASLTSSSAGQFHLKDGSRIGTSYIIKTQFEDWHARHPDWKTIDAAEQITGTVFPMMEVPEITIAGYKVGPVWFAERPDSTFHNAMSQMTDKQIDGAIGGSAFKYFVIVLDYPKATGYFTRIGSHQ